MLGIRRSVPRRARITNSSDFRNRISKVARAFALLNFDKITQPLRTVTESLRGVI